MRTVLAPESLVQHDRRRNGGRHTRRISTLAAAAAAALLAGQASATIRGKYEIVGNGRRRTYDRLAHTGKLAPVSCSESVTVQVDPTSNLAYPGLSGWLPRAGSVGAASGGLSCTNPGKSGSPAILGAATRFAVIGTVSGYQTPYLDVASTPEPTTWAMMILGAGLIGGVVRRARFGAVLGAAWTERRETGPSRAGQAR